MFWNGVVDQIQWSTAYAWLITNPSMMSIMDSTLIKINLIRIMNRYYLFKFNNKKVNYYVHIFRVVSFTLPALDSSDGQLLYKLAKNVNPLQLKSIAINKSTHD